ncbi:MAG: SGNH/GDSL hydrolase family protein [Saprospiraceae bacterium]|nr:SGNH/GDSL hydrolase family protein [Saprospiraceae bacterium]
MISRTPFIFILFLCISGGFHCSSSEIIEIPEVIVTPQPFNYLALGDSYTIGHGEKTEKTFPYLLQQSLTDKNYLFESNPKVIAKTGWTCDDLWAAIAKDSTLKNKYDMVSLLIGVNDQYRNYDIAYYPERFEKLVKKAIQLAGENPDNVIVVSIPDYAVTPFGQNQNPSKITKEIDAYNKINQEISERNHVHYVPITDISRMALNNPDLLVSDKLHPSGKMYGLWVERMLPKAESFLKK